VRIFRTSQAVLSIGGGTGAGIEFDVGRAFHGGWHTTGGLREFEELLQPAEPNEEFRRLLHSMHARCQSFAPRSSVVD
jgi:hypothetical protein